MNIIEKSLKLKSVKEYKNTQKYLTFLHLCIRHVQYTYVSKN